MKAWSGNPVLAGMDSETMAGKTPVDPDYRSGVLSAWTRASGLHASPGNPFVIESWEQGLAHARSPESPYQYSLGFLHGASVARIILHLNIDIDITR